MSPFPDIAQSRVMPTSGEQGDRVTLPIEQRFSKDGGKTTIVVQYDSRGSTPVSYVALQNILREAGYETLSTTYPGEPVSPNKG